MAKVVVIIPTYNERINTEKMIGELAEIVPHIKNHEVHVLYVDDTSPDGTAEIVEKEMKKYAWLHLLGGGTKQGLGAAYARGMTYAMKDMHADYLMEFDADFQHPPKEIPRLVEQIDHGYDYILASRYVKGGSVPADWTTDRKLVSFFGNLIARVGLLIPQIHDCTGGFKLSKVKGFMDEFDFSTLYSKKFAYKIHLLAYMVVAKKAKVKEVPFAFGNRTAGNSKYMTNEIKESLKVIFLFQLHNPVIIKFFKFGVVGGVGFVINYLGLKYFNKTYSGLPFPVGVINFLANATAAELSIISNFIFNNLWTFSQDKITKVTQLLSKFLAFNLSSIIGGILVPSLIIGLGTQFLGDQFRTLFLIIAVFGFTVPYNWIIYNKFIWKAKSKGMVPNQL
jgi:dolichol-phosphate mannosyltransferase